MTVSEVSLKVDGVAIDLLKDKITLSTNVIEGDNTSTASASISIPQDTEEKPVFITNGNARISNQGGHYSIVGFSKKKIQSRSGVKAQIKVSKQFEPIEFDFFDVLILTGVNHPHIAFFPDGNGKYFGQRGFLCNLTSSLDYNPKEKSISPSEISIEIESIAEKLIMKFEFDNDKKTVCLIDQYFV
jgi:hypothetical protein